MIEAYYEKGYDIVSSSPVSNMDGSIHLKVLHEFKTSSEWRAYEQERLEVAELQSVDNKAKGFDLVRRAAQQLSPARWNAIEPPEDLVTVHPSTLGNPTSEKRHFREPNLELLKNTEATLNRKNAAEALGTTERTLDRWVADNKLTPVGPESRKRFKTKDLLRFLNRKNPRQSRQE